VILSTHILPEASEVCQRVMIINKGRIVAEDTPERLTRRLRGAHQLYLQLARPAPEAAAALGQVPGVLKVAESQPGCYELESALDDDPRAALAELAVSRGWGLLELRPVGMSLEEIFLTLTTEEPSAADRLAEGGTAR